MYTNVLLCKLNIKLFRIHVTSIGHTEISNIMLKCVILHNVIIQDEANCNWRDHVMLQSHLALGTLVINPLTPSHLTQILPNTCGPVRHEDSSTAIATLH
jgi:hypothetical protein